MLTSHLRKTVYLPVLSLILILNLLITACEPLTPVANKTEPITRETNSTVYPNPVTSEQQLYRWLGGNLALRAILSDKPATANVYRTQLERSFTAESAQALARRFGITGEVYSAHDRISGTYMVTDGQAHLYARSDGFFEYYAGYSPERGVRDLDDNVAHTAIDKFMKSHDLDFEYQVERTFQEDGTFKLVPLLGGKPMHDTNFQTDGLFFNLDEDGNILTIFGGLYSTEVVGNYPIRSEQEAFQFILEDGLAGTLQSTERHGTTPPLIWYRKYPDDQQVTLYGNVNVFTPVKKDEDPILTLDQYFLAGNISGMEELDQWQLVVATGEFRTIDGIRQFIVENWKLSDGFMESRYAGLSQDQGFVILHADILSRTDYTLIDPPADIPAYIFKTGGSVFISGVPLPNGTFEWKTIQYNPLGADDIGNYHVDIGASSLYTPNFSGTPIPLPTPFPTPVVISTTAAGETFYTVQPGDTFGTIAQKFNTSADALMAVNHINEIGMLIVGGGLIIPPSLPKDFHGLRGTVQVIQYQDESGGSRTEYSILGNEDEYYQANMLLTGDSLQKLKDYQNRLVDIWGTLETIDSYGRPVVKVDHFEIPFPDVYFQIVKGTQRFVDMQNERVFLLETADGTYVELGPGGDPLLVHDTSIASPEDQVVAEVLIVPGEYFGEYPALRVYQQRFITSSGNVEQADSLFITANQPLVSQVKLKNNLDFRSPIYIVEKVELIYLISKPRASFSTETQSVYIQPMWRFSGRTNNGDTFEILVQALKDEFLSPEIQVIEGP